MKKIAIFVEGQTEQIFVTKLLVEIAGEKNIGIQQEKSFTKNGKRLFTVIDASSNNTTQKYYALIRDCGGDSCVKSDILDSYLTLGRKEYTQILGLRDVYPTPANNIPKLEQGLKYRVPTGGIPINIILAIMEIEAWFLAEVTHFSLIHPSLTHQLIVDTLSFDPITQDVETRPHPSQDIKHIYRKAGFSYDKTKSRVQRTIHVLDYPNIYFNLRNNVKKLGKFIDVIDSFLSP
jgi:hypothetical protein